VNISFSAIPCTRRGYLFPSESKKLMYVEKDIGILEAKEIMHGITCLLIEIIVPSGNEI
jgi:hypothetical protein